MREIEPKNWTELQEVLFDYDVGITAPGRYRSPYVYRGASENYSDLKTSLMMIEGPYHELESALLRNFLKYSGNIRLDFNSEWYCLFLAQHHGLPTRLLDWTYSPYVALHFATDDSTKSDQDGVIWRVNYQTTKKFLPVKLQKTMDQDGFIFTANCLRKGIANIKQLNDHHKKYGDFVIFIEPPSIDSRIVNQYALFSMMSSPKKLLNEWLNEHNHINNLYNKIIIPAKMKWKIRDHLDQANINERVLFPGLDGLASYLKRYYSAKDINKS
jgi:hypothetical protein